MVAEKREFFQLRSKSTRISLRTPHLSLLQGNVLGWNYLIFSLDLISAGEKTLLASKGIKYTHKNKPRKKIGRFKDV